MQVIGGGSELLSTKKALAMLILATAVLGTIPFVAAVSLFPQSTELTVSSTGVATGHLSQGINGTITYGPTAPICTFSQPTPVKLDWAIVVTTVSGHLILVPVNWLLVGQCEYVGTFIVYLAPGAYSVDFTGPKWSTAFPIPVTVQPHVFTQLKINIVTGIV